MECKINLYPINIAMTHAACKVSEEYLLRISKSLILEQKVSCALQKLTWSNISPQRDILVAIEEQNQCVSIFTFLALFRELTSHN